MYREGPIIIYKHKSDVEEMFKSWEADERTCHHGLKEGKYWVLAQLTSI